MRKIKIEARTKLEKFINEARMKREKNKKSRVDFIKFIVSKNRFFLEFPDTIKKTFSANKKIPFNSL